MLTSLLGFIGVSALIIMTPGPDTALTIRNAISGGRRSGVYTGLGVALGQLVWTVAASIGVLGILLASERAFEVLKLVGAGYLVYLGFHSLRAAARPADQLDSRSAVKKISAVSALRQGIVNDLANPKMAAFFASLLPQFVSSGAGATTQMLGLGAVFSVMTFAWLSCYALALARFRKALRRGKLRRTIDAVAGATLVAFAIRLATSPAP